MWAGAGSMGTPTGGRCTAGSGGDATGAVGTTWAMFSSVMHTWCSGRSDGSRSTVTCTAPSIAPALQCVSNPAIQYCTVTSY
jgi:hypothetical protein